MAHYGQKNYKLAILDYQLAIKLYPSSIYIMNLGFTYLYNKDYKKGIIICLEDVIKSAPSDPKNYYNLSVAYNLSDNNQVALFYLEQALEKGYKNYEHILDDPDLANIRQLAEFRIC